MAAETNFPVNKETKRKPNQEGGNHLTATTSPLKCAINIPRRRTDLRSFFWAHYRSQKLDEGQPKRKLLEPMLRSGFNDTDEDFVLRKLSESLSVDSTPIRMDTNDEQCCHTLQENLQSSGHVPLKRVSSHEADLQSLPHKRRRYQRRNSFVIRRNKSGSLSPPALTLLGSDFSLLLQADAEAASSEFDQRTKGEARDSHSWGSMDWANASWANTEDTRWYSSSLRDEHRSSEEQNCVIPQPSTGQNTSLCTQQPNGSNDDEDAVNESNQMKSPAASASKKVVSSLDFLDIEEESPRTPRLLMAKSLIAPRFRTAIPYKK